MDIDEVVRRTLEAWNHDDVDAWLATLGPDAVYHTSGVFPGLEPSYFGHDGCREFWRAMHEPWESLRLDLERVDAVDAGRAVIEFRFRGVGAESGAAVDLRFSNAARMGNGLVLEIFAARSSDEALARLEAS